MAQRRKTSKDERIISQQAGRLCAAFSAWWWELPAPHRRSICAISSAMGSLLLLLGMLPLTRHAWIAAFSHVLITLLGWGAPLSLLSILLLCGTILAEAIRQRSLVRQRWLWCSAAGLVLLLGESHLLFAAPSGLIGLLVAALASLLPGPASQVLVLGALLINALIAFRISWHTLERGMRSLIWRRSSVPDAVMAPAPGDAVDAAALAPLPYMTAGQAAAIIQPMAPTPPPLSTPLVERRPALTIATGDDDEGLADLAVPTYLRRAMPSKETFALPPLPARSFEDLARDPWPATGTEGPARAATPLSRDPKPALAALPPIAARSANAKPLPTPITRLPTVPTIPVSAPLPRWTLPPLRLLNAPPESRVGNAVAYAERLAVILERTLKSFGVDAEVRRSDISVGPTILRFGIRPLERIRQDEHGRALIDAQGEPIVTRTRVSRIMNLKNDLALALEVKSLRMEAPVPERPYVGIEVPHALGHLVTVREVLESRAFQEAAVQSKLAVPLGRDVAGKVRIGDLARFPHVLVAGATGAGKSVCLNAFISALITQATPDEVRLIMVDPKVVELKVYDGIPHLLVPVITEPSQVVGALEMAIAEMERRYQIFSQCGVRNIEAYELLCHNGREQNVAREGRSRTPQEGLPRIVLIIDELADLMMVAADDIEHQICRLAQLSRATGIHLVVATQRPSVDVITGIIKANIPTRIAFMVSSAVDSRTILDGGGAEHLLGKGDMLFLASDAARAERIQGAYVADDEIERLVHFWRSQTPETHEQAEWISA